MIPPQEQSYREIPLTRGKVAIVDSDDYERLSSYKWHVGGGSNNVWYASRAAKVNGRHRTVMMHREIMQVVGSEQIDHINRNGLDNRKSNLRLCNRSQNQANSPSVTKYGYRGIMKTAHNRWHAHIKVNGKSMYLGTCATPEDAAKLYDTAARKAFGEFATLNFPEGTRIMREHGRMTE